MCAASPAVEAFSAFTDDAAALPFSGAVCVPLAGALLLARPESGLSAFSPPDRAAEAEERGTGSILVGSAGRSLWRGLMTIGSGAVGTCG